jgi:hypothetical protein
MHRHHALIGSVIALFAVLALPGASLGSPPSFGLPPLPGGYKLLTRESSGPGSKLTLRQQGGGYEVTGMRIRLPKSCEEYAGDPGYAGEIATVEGSIRPLREVLHRVGEDEVIWRYNRKKHFRRTGEGNVRVTIGGETFAGNLFLVFIRGIHGFHPVAGDLDLTNINRECVSIFTGHRATV